MPLTNRALSEEQRQDWLRLIRSENVGPATFWRLLQAYPSAREALDALPELAARGGRKRPIKIASSESIGEELRRAKKLDARFIACGENDYPKNLAAIPSPPPLLCVRGHTALFNRRLVAMVGARNASAIGIRLATNIAADLGQAGFTIVSGLARGIDTAAHQGSLSTGTIAVLAGGADSIYPPENDTLYTDIVTSGAVLSELPLGVVAQARDFPRRNRIISGLSLGVLVVEASLKSGSLITARFAGEQGREVFAVPGSPLDPRAKGPNDLIRQGAALIETATDIINALEALPSLPLFESEGEGFDPFADGHLLQKIDEREIDQARRKIQSLLSPSPVSVDELIRLSNAHPGAVHTVLLELELAGRLQRHTGDLVSLL